MAKFRTTLLPGTIEDRAKIRALSLQIIANTQPLQNMLVLEYFSNDPVERAKWARHWIERSFTQLEKVLQKTSGKYAYGDTLSLLDTCIPPQVYNARRLVFLFVCFWIYFFIRHLISNHKKKVFLYKK